MAGHDVSEAGRSEATGTAGVAETDVGVADAADVSEMSSAADAVGDDAITDAATDVAGVDPDADTFEMSAPNEGAPAGTVAVDEVDPAAATAAGEVALAEARANNPAGFLGDSTIDRAQMDERLQAMSTVELTGLLDGIDQPEMGYGEAVTSDGWAALDAEIDRRFTEAVESEDYANPELAELSREVNRHNRAPYSEYEWRNNASLTLGWSDPAALSQDARDTQAVLRETRDLISDRVNTGLSPHNMTNGQLIEAVRATPGLEAMSGVFGLTGVGILHSFAAEGTARERIAELETRMADGRLPPMDVEALTSNDTARAVGVGVLAAEVASAFNVRGLVTDGIQGAIRWGRRRLDDVFGSAAPRALRYGPGEAAPAFADTRRVQHASRHLIEDGVLPNWNNTTRRLFAERGAEILENPQHTVQGWTLGPHTTDIYVGEFNGRTVGIAVFRDGPHSGKVATAFVPDANQRQLWGLN